MTTSKEIEAAEREVNKNYAYFKKMKDQWENDHLYHFVLIHHQKLVDFFESEHDAFHTGIRDYGLGNFSVQSVRDEVVDLGHQSHVLL